MKISVNTLRYYQKLYNWSGDPAPDGVDALVQKIGAQLGGVEETIEAGKKYDGVIIVKVVACEDHPNADRLHVCMIDDGGVVKDVPRDDNGMVQVVCGAPNVTAGVTVAWLPPGATVPSTYDNDPFVLEARELRGVVSNGMLASPKELAIGDSHEGLLLIDEEVSPGTMFADKFNLRGDIIIDIENKMFTHRPDLFGWIGVAREVVGIQGQKFTSPEWYAEDASAPSTENETLPVDVRNEIPELVPRFTAVAISDIQLGPSPVWLQVELAKHGLRPINNIVDLTNYYMLLTGQPLHAYDYDKVKALDGSDKATLVVRKPHEGEKLTLLNGKEVEPRGDAILIATESQAIGLGGVMGGGNTEVDDNTRNIILECATFDMYSIRRASMANGIFTDAVTRFNKGQSPLQNIAVLARIVKDIEQICKGTVASRTIDDNHTDTEAITGRHEPITVPVKFIIDRLGVQLTDKEIVGLLENVEFHAHDMGEAQEVCVSAPFWRTDIEIPEDLVEEVGRLYGYDRLPLELPKRAIVPADRNAKFDLQTRVRSLLGGAGANEVLTYSFVHGNLLESVGQDKNMAYKLGNALSPDLHYYRISLSPSLLERVNPNIRAGYDEFALFEQGKAHLKEVMDQDESGVPQELSIISFVYASRSAKKGSAYYEARKYLDYLLTSFQAESGVVYKSLADVDLSSNQWLTQIVAPFEPKRSALLGTPDGKWYGVIGEYKASVRKGLKLPDYTAGFEIGPALLQPGIAMSTYQELPRFPKVWQDISLKVRAGTTYEQVFDVVNEALQAEATDALHLNMAPVDIYQREDDQEHKQVTLRLTVASYEKTMTDTEVNELLDKAAQAAGDKLGAERL